MNCSSVLITSLARQGFARDSPMLPFRPLYYTDRRLLVTKAHDMCGFILQGIGHYKMTGGWGAKDN